MSTTPETKRQLAGRKTTDIPAPMLPAQVEAIQATLPLVQNAINDLLAENLAGETGPSGIPSQIWIRLVGDDKEQTGRAVIVLERIIPTETPSIIQP